jgi:hypothetical protein
MLGSTEMLQSYVFCYDLQHITGLQTFVLSTVYIINNKTMGIVMI